MSLPLNKERVFVLLTFGVCGLLYNGLNKDAGRAPNVSKPEVEMTIKPVGASPLVETDAEVAGRRDLFTQPRETQPLPPRSIAFPPRTPASVVALPLSLGPDYRHMVLLASDGDVVPDVSIDAGAGVATAESSEPEPGNQEPPDRAARLQQADKTYARVWLQGMSAPFRGIVEVVDATTDATVDRFDAEQLKDFSQVIVRLRLYNVEKDSLGRQQVWKPGDLNKVVKIQLADNLTNEIERSRRAIPDGDLVRRADFIVWLLEQAAQDVAVFDIAMQQAKQFSQEAGNNLDGLRWQLRVLSARGDIAGTWALLEGITGPNRESALRYEALGRLKMTLGLWHDAGADLQRAVELSPSDARPHAAWADYLLARGRSREAAAAAREAQRTFGSVIDDADKVAVVRTIVAGQLAVGAIDAAKTARLLISAAIAPPYLDGCIAYAEGDIAAALAAFRRASGSTTSTGDRGEARLGEAACLVRLGQWQQAHDAFVAVHDERPLLRHLACAGLSLLYQRIGNFEPALSWAERALEADPTFAYAHYLRGRALRSAGQPDAAEEALQAALGQHDDFVHAITELATLFAERAETSLTADYATQATNAMRYGDRAVALAPVERPELYEFQGMRHFATGDRRGAANAFERSRGVATADADKLFARGAIAVVDYSRGRVDDAIAVLVRMTEDLAKEDAVRVWADDTIKAIEEHAQKELLVDRFERAEPGNIWPEQRDGGLRTGIVGGRLVWSGKLTRNGEVSVERSGAVQKGKNFLAVSVKMQLGTRHSNTGFAGLRIMAQQGSNGRTDSRIEVGIRDGEPQVGIIDNREEKKWISAEVLGFDITAEHELELRVLPQGDAQGRTFLLQVSWNGQIVHAQELKSLSGATQTELKTILFAQGTRSQIDVAFDDYRLERKKER